MKKKPTIQNNNIEKIHFFISHNKSYEIIKDNKDLKSAFADFVFCKSQITWQQFMGNNYENGGSEKCKDNMIKNIPKNITDQMEPNTNLFSTKLNKEYRIIFSRIDKIMIIHYISKHYGEH